MMGYGGGRKQGPRGQGEERKGGRGGGKELGNRSGKQSFVEVGTRMKGNVVLGEPAAGR